MGLSTTHLTMSLIVKEQSEGDKWTPMDLYHALVGKIQQMKTAGKFNGYAYKFKTEQSRGPGPNKLKITGESVGGTESWFDTLDANFGFDVMQEHPATKTMRECYTTVNIHYQNDSFYDGDPSLKHLKLKVIVYGQFPWEDLRTNQVHWEDVEDLETVWKTLEFPWEDLCTQQVDLDTVVNHYFENCFLEVPLYQLHTNPDLGSLDQDDNLDQRYEAIVNFYKCSLAFAMSQHKRLGHSSAFWDLPDCCLALIHQLLKPQF